MESNSSKQARDRPVGAKPKAPFLIWRLIVTF
jgi:hypothetical protein